MKNLLIRLTSGLYEQDVAPDEQPLVDGWLQQKILLRDAGLYRLPSQFRAGVLARIQAGKGAYLQVLGVNVPDLFIEHDDLKGAREGDLVFVRRQLARRGAPTAKVVEVVGRAESYSVAHLVVKEGHKTLLDIRNDYPVGATATPEVLAQYDEGMLFKINNQNGEIMEVLGHLDDPAVDEKVVLALYNKHDDFEEDVKRLARSFDKEVDASRYPNRKDLRKLPFCTIDPVTAKDFDDAICYVPREHKLYVAIADVSAYVEPFGPIDAEATYRGFSIYLPHRSIPMLPRELSETLCSLQPHVDRLAYTFEMTLDPETRAVVDTQLYEAIIHSQRRFTYEEVDTFFEGKHTAQSPEEGTVLAWLAPLRTLTDALRADRLKAGYDFHSEELQMVLDATQQVTATTVSQETPSHALIEDCMLLANKAAAAMYERGVFRIHETPSPAKLQSLFQELAAVGIIAEQQESLKETIDFIQKEAEKRDLVHEVDTLIIRSQMQARYAPDNVGHFGLGFERYTHFTSPIRRYADLTVHRLLKAILAGDKTEGSYVLRNIDALCYAISDKEREAGDVEQRFMERKFARWAHAHLNEAFPARIQSIDPHLNAEITSPIRGARLEVTTHEALTLFDDIIVRIESVNLASARIKGVFLRMGAETDFVS